MKYLWYGILIMAAFIAGYGAHQPKVITKVEWKKIYAEPSLETMKAVAGLNGYLLITQEEIRQTKNDNWANGYSEGFKAGINKIVQYQTPAIRIEK